MTAKPRRLQPGEHFHVLSPRGALIAGAAYRRGDTLTLTAEQIESQRDRLGNSWADDVSEAGQLARWGEVRIGLGPWPEDTPKLLPGSVEHSEAREAARRAAHALQNPDTRLAALRAVEADFGPSPATSRTVGGPSDPLLRKAADEERARRRAEAAKAPRKPRDLALERSLDEVLDLGRAEAWNRADALREAVEDGGLR